MFLFLEKLYIFFISILIIFLFVNIDANAQKNSRKAKNMQTRIRSDIIDIKQKSQKIDFIGNVVVERDDVSLLSNKMEVFYIDKASNEVIKNNNSNIKEIKAFGNVKMFNDEFVASSDLANFYPDKNIFILEKNVIVNNGTSILTGDKFIYDVKTKKGNFIGQKISNNSEKNNNKNGDDRVTVIIGDDLKEQNKYFKKNDK
jgi:lipopolysaccharide transport protein LptA